MQTTTTAADMRNQLILSLQHVYQTEAFGALAELLQGEALVLGYLAQHTDTVYPSVLSRCLHLSRPRITGALNSLRRKGLIELEPSREDRRRIQVFITESGREQIEEQYGRMLAYFDQMIAGLGSRDTQALICLIDRGVAAVQEQRRDV